MTDGWDPDNYYVLKYGDAICPSALHPFPECVECRYKDDGEQFCPCGVVSTIVISDEEFETIRCQIN